MFSSPKPSRVSVEYTGTDANTALHGGCWGCLERFVEVVILIALGIAIYYGVR